ncbi:MAG: chromate transporter [Chloroflexi bacterium]|nr:chromate transporter [Chloroflexota bacterium]
MLETLQTWWQIFLSMASVGTFGYGGGPSVIPLIKKEAVDVHHWMDAAEFTDALAFGNSLPGPIATKMSAYIGFKIAGLPGALSGVLGMVVPSFILILVLASIYMAFKDDARAKGALTAVRPVILALLAFTTYDLLPKTGGISWDYIAIAAVAFLLMVFTEIHPALIILAAALIGVFFYGR